MNVLLLSLLYPKETQQEVAGLSRDGLQNQINGYQWALVQGIDGSLLPGERLDIVNALPVGIFPTHYRRLFLQGGLRDGRIRELGGLNLPWVKQKMREKAAERALEDWMGESPENRTILVYTLYLPYMRAIARVKRRRPELRAAVIVTDLPNQWGISSGRQGLMKKLEYALGEKRLALCRAFDGFVLLTAQMGEVLPVEDKPCMILEGLLTAKGPAALLETGVQAARPAVLYSGTLNRELGIHELLEAFKALPECDLWLCGRGDMEKEAAEYASRFPNIRYDGFLPQEQVFLLQSKATLLINPRSPEGLFTRYSFPSKTMEYMRSGKPVLCYHLQGIPADYDPYLCYIRDGGPEGIRSAVRETLALEPAARRSLGMAGKAYVEKEKSAQRQCGRLTAFLRGLEKRG